MSHRQLKPKILPLESGFSEEHHYLNYRQSRDEQPQSQQVTRQHLQGRRTEDFKSPGQPPQSQGITTQKSPRINSEDQSPQHHEWPSQHSLSEASENEPYQIPDDTKEMLTIFKDRLGPLRHKRQDEEKQFLARQNSSAPSTTKTTAARESKKKAKRVRFQERSPQELSKSSGKRRAP
ncbi:hypothetical protein BDV32DRAFT_154689 [Aspergillus pseudonomiae]|uniref:Uncharacterized protein n=1 Tax=Aspergillus pseudonomiae TaxID=1506151 RepID=A0A5N6HKR7_9EURO|nr:uncharacterized protein BDV37DRAFT_263273 [Aspergillus pseudonomiae]KAB8255026.1 hypothetical protein BDV32DRAFT_154689 [Aspergillus pseudonomiae]KAE8398474.1 hypothetical protein BDV37DRAFT_263273 [Aspergillus pseudonomiae]